MRMTRAVPFVIGILAGALAASGAPAADPPPAAGTAAAPDAEKGAALIAKAVEGLGGAAVVDGVKTLELRGKGTRTAPSGMEVPIETTTRILYPGRYRQDIKISLGEGEPVGVATVVTDQEAFLLSEEGAQPLKEDQRASLASSFRRNLVTLLRARSEPSFAPTRSGAATIDATPVELVRVVVAGETISLAIDPATGHVLRLTCANVGTVPSTTGELTILYSDFRQAGPLVYPFSSTGTLDGKKVYESKLEAVVVDGPIEESLFTAPPKPAPAPAAPEANAPAPPPPPPPAPKP